MRAISELFLVKIFPFVRNKKVSRKPIFFFLLEILICLNQINMILVLIDQDWLLRKFWLNLKVKGMELLLEEALEGNKIWDFYIFHIFFLLILNFVSKFYDFFVIWVFFILDSKRSNFNRKLCFETLTLMCFLGFHIVKSLSLRGLE